MHSPPPVHSPPGPPQPRTALGAAWVLAVCSALLLTLVAVEWPPLTGLDDDIADTTHRWAVDEPGVTHAMRILSDWVWDTWTMRALCVVVVVWLWRRHGDRWTAVWLAATCLLGSLLQQVLKAAVDRPRPVWPDPVDSAHFAAFPSGHAMTATFVCGLLAWLAYHYDTPRTLRRTVLTVALVSVLGVGVTRVWLGVHWTTDVLGGWLLGALLVTLATLTHRRLHP